MCVCVCVCLCLCLCLCVRVRVCVCVCEIVPDVGILAGKVLLEKLVLLLVDVDLGCQKHDPCSFGKLLQVIFTDGQSHNSFSTS